MKKTDINVSGDTNNLWEKMNLKYPEGEKDVNAKIEEIIEMIDNDKIESTSDLATHIAMNFYQEELVLIATNSIDKIYRRIKKGQMREKADKEEMLFKNFMSFLAGMKKTIDDNSVCFASHSKEEMIIKLEKHFTEKGIKIDTEKLSAIENKDEFVAELQRQIKDNGYIIGGVQIDGGVFIKSNSTN